MSIVRGRVLTGRGEGLVGVRVTGGRGQGFTLTRYLGGGGGTVKWSPICQFITANKISVNLYLFISAFFLIPPVSQFFNIIQCTLILHFGTELRYSL